MKGSNHDNGRVFCSDDNEGELRKQRAFKIEKKGRRRQAVSKEVPLDSEASVTTSTESSLHSRLHKNAMVGVRAALHDGDRMNALAIANRCGLSDDLRIAAGFSPALNQAEQTRRAAALAAARA